MVESSSQPVDPEALAAQLEALPVDQFVLASASTLASLAFAKLGQADLGQAKQAIDALSALLPHVAGELKGDLERALTDLQVAYATAASS